MPEEVLRGILLTFSYSFNGIHQIINSLIIMRRTKIICISLNILIYDKVF